ncbi:MAG: WecB/TagA/CpsF family glycosyltransferase [Kiritimatiellia bacterium]
MNLLVDCIPYDAGRSGISVYVRSLVQALQDEGHELTLLVEPRERDTFPGIPKIVAPAWTTRPAWSMLWHLFLLPRRLRRLASQFDGLLITAANRRACRTYPIPTVATIHDLAHCHIPRKYSPLRTLYLKAILPRYAKRADHLLAISQTTADDLVRHWRTPPSRLTVAPNGYTPPPPSKGGWLARHNLRPGGYILYVARIEHPGKNHLSLLQAFALLNRPGLQLVCAGSDWHRAQTVHDAARRNPLAKAIHFTGYIPDTDLREAYASAALYAFPSLYEGFGLPLLEALSAGIPCACSDLGALNEIASGIAETFDPRSPQDIARALAKLLDENPSERAERIRKGKARAATYTWRRHAQTIARLLETPPRPKCVDLFGIPVSTLTLRQTAHHIIRLIQTPQPRTQIIATVNADFLANAVPCPGFSHNPELLAILRHADLATPDGFPLLILARLVRTRIPQRVTGADLVPILTKMLASGGHSCYILGGEKISVANAIAALQTANPGLRIVGTDTGIVNPDDAPAAQRIAREINAAKPDILFLALGNPKQELWLGRYAHLLQVPVAIGVGGTFNFIAGSVRRAPLCLQHCGLEWLWRLAQEPRRLCRRYGYDFAKLALLALRILCERRRRAPEDLT